MKRLSVLLLSVILAFCTFAFSACDLFGDGSITVTDFNGDVIHFDAPVQSAIAFGPADTSIMIALDEIDKIAGKGVWDTFPELNDDLPTFDGYSLNAEEILAINPEVIFALPNSSGDSVLTQLKGLGIKVVMLDAVTIDDIYKKIEIISTVLGVKSKGDDLISEIKSDLEAVKSSVSGGDKKSVYVELDSWDGLYTCGLTTFINEVLEYAGCENALKSALSGNPAAWVNISAEQVIAANPHSIIYSDYGMPEDISTRAGFSAIDAVINGRIYGVDANLISQAGPNIARLAQAIKEAVHG